MPKRRWKMTYKGVEIKVSRYGTYHLVSPVNHTKRIFKTLELAKNYIDNAEDLELRAKYMR